MGGKGEGLLGPMGRRSEEEYRDTGREVRGGDKSFCFVEDSGSDVVEGLKLPSRDVLDFGRKG